VRETTEQAGQRMFAFLAQLNLGRAAARRGSFEEADTLLAEALEGFQEIHAASFEQETRARIAEAAMLAGDSERALREADVAEQVGESGPPPLLQAILHRVRGCAHLLAGRVEEGAAELDQGLDEARRVGALYEIALILEVRMRLPGHDGDSAERQEILDALRIERTADTPLN
jgi:tetratricopeptide (TPR) repeat protein